MKSYNLIFILLLGMPFLSGHSTCTRTTTTTHTTHYPKCNTTLTVNPPSKFEQAVQFAVVCAFFVISAIVYTLMPTYCARCKYIISDHTSKRQAGCGHYFHTTCYNPCIPCEKCADERVARMEQILHEQQRLSYHNHCHNHHNNGTVIVIR